MKAMALGLFALLAATRLLAAAAADAVLEPFVAEYDVRYGRMAVGSSRTELSHTGASWAMESTSTAAGFARVIASGTLKQRSEFELLPDGPRPAAYRFDDGTKRTSRDVHARIRLACRPRPGNGGRRAGGCCDSPVTCRMPPRCRRSCRRGCAPAASPARSQ